MNKEKFNNWNVLKQDINYSELKKIWGLFFIVSMTTKWKKDNKYYYELNKSYFNKKSYIILSQVKSIDKKRFFEHIWTIKEDDFEYI